MKIMKRFSLLIVLAICITVGGVYAQWVYEDHDFVGGEAHNVDLSMQPYVNPGNQQGYFVDKYVNLVVEVADNLDGSTPVPPNQKGDYHADLSGHGSMLFLFKAYEQTTLTDMSSLTFNITFQEQSPIYYNDGVNNVRIFNYRNAQGKQLTPLTAENVDALVAKYTYLNKAEIESELTTAVKPGLYYFELTYEHLFQTDIDPATPGNQYHIELNPDFSDLPIDNLEKWDVLQEAILGGSVTVYITDSRQAATP